MFAGCDGGEHTDDASVELEPQAMVAAVVNGMEPSTILRKRIFKSRSFMARLGRRVPSNPLRVYEQDTHGTAEATRGDCPLTNLSGRSGMLSQYKETSRGGLAVNVVEC
jgi:hypothetical protein